jgi:alkylation response protein AidB-like acyl-CoA dehydrogenase
MTIARTAEQAMFGDTLRRFLDAENDLESRRRRLGADPPARLALWNGIAELGAIGAAFDEASGGFAGDARTIAIAMMELGRALAVEPFLACAVVAGSVLAAQSDLQRALDPIARIIAGESIVVLAHDAGADPFGEPLVSAELAHGAYVLNGRVRCVRHGDVADEFLVPALMGDAVAIFRLAKDFGDACDPSAVAGYRLMDGSGAADLRLSDVRVERQSRLRFNQPESVVLSRAIERGLFGLAAETAGIITAANRATFRYLGERKQFGATLSSFQALRHRAADMEIASQELLALLELAIECLGGDAHGGRSALVSALKVVADTAGRIVGHEAVQLHGGMGVSDELHISHYARRLATIRAELGSADVHTLRFGTDVAIADLLALKDSAETREWREFVRDFTRTNLPARIARKGELGLKIDKEDYVGWQKVLHRHGLFGCAWPEEFGGGNWDLVKQLLFVQESSVCNAPMLVPFGVNMVGPVLYTFGTRAQQQQHLAPILASDVWWCQGYSEPGAGSDLASLKTFAEREGDEYVVNGSKLWTTEAHWADWMHCLVRTDRGGKPQSGITFLLIDMKSPGISIKPIITIDGLHHTNALFLDNVRVPVANRVGDEGAGWTIAKFLLSKERVSIADTGPKLRLLDRVRDRWRTVSRESSMPAALRGVLAAKLAALAIELLSLCTMERQFVEAWSNGAPFGAEASILKVRGTEVLQALCELALEMEGPMAAAHDPADVHRNPHEPLTAAQQASLMGHEYLYSRCWSIFGGTNEIQRNIIAGHALKA